MTLKLPVTETKLRELRQQMHQANLCEDDIQESFVRSSGPGGQNANKTATCVVLKHRPSGITVRYDRERSQGLNRFFARRRLTEELLKQSGIETKNQRIIAKKKKQKSRRKRRSSSKSCKTQN